MATKAIQVILGIRIVSISSTVVWIERMTGEMSTVSPLNSLP
jgi:hypothetical protein